MFGNNAAWGKAFGRQLQEMFETSVQRKTLITLLSAS